MLATDEFIWKRAIKKKVCFLIRDVIVLNRKKIRNYRKTEEKSIQNIITQQWSLKKVELFVLICPVLTEKAIPHRVEGHKLQIFLDSRA